MKITRRQLNQLIKEVMRNPDEIDSQDMADAKRYAGDSVESMAAYLRISVEDWHRIRKEMDEWYEDRHALDQMEWEEEAGDRHPLDDDGDGNVDWDEISENKMKALD